MLRSPRETAQALRYVLENYAHHAREHLQAGFRDPCSSARWIDGAPADAPVAPAGTWLLGVGWRRVSVLDR